MTTPILPQAPPKLTRSAALDYLSLASVTPDPVHVLGIRGYYRDSMGAVGRNDRGIYDDALFVLTPNVYAAFNANVDPARWGINPKIGKPYAALVPGTYRYKPGWHKKGTITGHLAFVQAEPVTVERREALDKPKLLETGLFGINIHRGGEFRTSSEGCQTLPHQQWQAFYSLVTVEMKRAAAKTFLYTLIDYEP